VVISHGHPDRYGLVGAAHQDVPLYIGEATSRILAEAAFFSPAGADLHPGGFLFDRVPFQLGPFRVTPFLVDHSAFDAYAVLVEANA
jgi:ribonuclease J